MKLEPIIINKKYYPLPNDLENLKNLEKFLTYIDQPENAKLSSLLQIYCAITNRPKI